MTFGLTATGFVAKTLTDVQAELEDKLRADFGMAINLDPSTVFGQLVGIFSEQLADLWDLAQAVNTGFDPAAASGSQLEALAALTGTYRKPATQSAVTVIATGANGTFLPAGSAVTTGSAGVRFLSTADATITTAAAWAPSFSYALGARVANGGNLYEATAAGVSASSGGPTGFTDGIADGTVTWRWLATATALAALAMVSESVGPIAAPARTLTQIATPVSGWAAATNPVDAVLGRLLETDAALRLRREDEIRKTGNAALDAIRAKVLGVSGVTAVTVFDNPTDTTNADGVPPHSVETMVQGGADADIRAAVFGAMAGGIQSYGTTSGTLTDSQGAVHTVKFTRPGQVLVYATLSVLADASVFPADGAAQIAAAVLAFGSRFATGRDVTAAGLSAQAFVVPGVLDVTALIGTAPAPATSATVAIAPRQVASFDNARISVNVTFGTP